MKRTDPPAADHPWLRAVTLLAALVVSGVVLLVPQWLTTQGGTISHGELTLLMAGIALGFVYGVGFSFRHPFLRIALGPVPAWLLMLGVPLWYWGFQ